MKPANWVYATLLLLATIIFPTSLNAQCQSRVLVSPAGEGPQASYAVSIATLDHHCLTGGSYTVHTMPPGAVMFENGMDSFFDIFLEVSTDHYVREIELTPLLLPGIIFQMMTEVTFDDPWYPPQMIVEDCWVNPVTMMFEFFSPVPIPELVPASMSLGQSECFMVAHKVYKIPLVIPGPGLRPSISITPGCLPEDNCIDNPACSPGGEDDYRADIYKEAEQWYLEFEYSNASLQPVCYCVFYYMAWPELWDMYPLIGLDEREQTVTLSATSQAGAACGTVELFSYPPGAEIEPLPGGNQFMVTGERQVIGEVAVSRGAFLPGDEFYLVSYFDFSEMCVEAESEWKSERVRVTPAGTLQVIDHGGECDPTVVYVPREMSIGQAECIVVCHDVYYIQLNAPTNMMPEIQVTFGCEPPCVMNPDWPPATLENCQYSIERIGTHWYLRFEHSNPRAEPVTYCLYYYGIAPINVESNVLAVFDETTQGYRISLWGSSPTIPLSGTMVVSAQPVCEPEPWTMVQSFFDVFMEPQMWQPAVPVWCHDPGEAFQVVATFTFDNPGVPPNVYREWVVANPDMTLSRYVNPTDPQCADNVPPLMAEGQSSCFTVCHDVYEVQLVGPPGRPIISIVPGCEPPCIPPVPCTPGAPSDYLWWLTGSGSNWTLHFEYSNQFVQPACYCVTYAGTEPVFEPHVLACWDELTQDLDVSVAVSNPSGLPANASGTITIYTVPAEAAVVLPYPNTFAGLNDEWHHITAQFDIPPIEPESFFDIWCEVEFTTPGLPPISYREPVHVVASPPEVWIENVDEGGECTGTNIPPYGLYPGQSWCFIVCHDVYHVPIYSVEFPTIHVTPGCFSQSQDDCEPWECIPGGFWDYRYDVFWDPLSMNWVLEFEYSNQMIEPVCYCVSVLSPPCEPAADLTIMYSEDQLGIPSVQLNWIAPQAAIYNIYSTVLPNHATLPPGPDWTLEESVIVSSSGPQVWTQLLGLTDYKYYLILVDCPVGSGR